MVFIGLLVSGESDLIPFRAQLSHPLVGMLGKSLVVKFYLYATNSKPFSYEGKLVDSQGRLTLSGKWDLILDEIQDEHVIASASLKKTDSSGGALPTVTMRPYEGKNCEFTWDAQSIFDHVGNYRFRLRYEEQSWDGEQFRIDKTLDPPPWIELAVTPDKLHAVIGEPVLVTVQVTNKGTDSYPAHFGGDYRGASRALRFYCTAERSDGLQGTDPKPLQTCMGGIGEFGPLAPGATRKRTLSLGAYVRCPHPGRYRVTVYHALGFGTPVPEIDRNRFAVFGPYAKAGDFMLDLEAPTPGDAERIVRLGLSAREEYEQYQLIGHLHEPYFLDALQDALAQENLRKHGPVIIDGIDSIQTLQATTALIKALDHPDNATKARAMERLRFRMPQSHWFMQSKLSAEQFARLQLEKTLVDQVWNEEQSNRLRTKVEASIRSANPLVLQKDIDLLGLIGDREAAEEIADLADGQGATTEALDQNSATMNHLENASYTLGLRKITPCTVAAESTPGRRICWARMLDGRLEPPTSETDALLMEMVKDRSKAVRLAGLRGLGPDAGARVALPWKELFQDLDQSIFHTACHLSERAPNAMIAKLVHECLQENPLPDRQAYFTMMLQHLEPATPLDLEKP